MEFNKYLKRFLEHKKLVEDRSDSTINVYRVYIGNFINWYEKNYNPFKSYNIKEINHNHIDEYLMYLSKDAIKVNSSESKKTKLTVLKSFFNYLKNKDIIKINILDTYSFQTSTKKRVPKHFNTEEVEKLLNAIGDNDRNRTMILLYLNTGLRLHELAKLNVGSVDNETLIIKGKGDHERTIYLNSAMLEVLESYIDSLDDNSFDAPLFISNRNRRLSERSIQKIITDIEKSAGLRTGVHILRHTFATYMLQHGNASLEVIQELLGHSRITTTQMYATVAKTKIKKVINDNPIGLTAIH
jgi:site-specific recombinase XerD